MGKQYEGNVEVFVNKETKKVNIRPNPEGDFNKENADALYKFMKQVADKTGFKLNMFVPDSSKAEVPVLLASMRFGGKPYLAMLDKIDESKSSVKKTSPIEVFKPTK
jgi:hypothetical protein